MMNTIVNTTFGPAGIFSKQYFIPNKAEQTRTKPNNDWDCVACVIQWGSGGFFEKMFSRARKFWRGWRLKKGDRRNAGETAVVKRRKSSDQDFAARVHNLPVAFLIGSS
jgi:hypothetical protein